MRASTPPDGKATHEDSPATTATAAGAASAAATPSAAVAARAAATRSASSATTVSSPASGLRPCPPVALYVHVPFCVSQCPYCDFVVYAGADARGPRSRLDAFLVALERELELRADAVDRRFGPPGPARPPLASVYLGGGTPSLMPAARVAQLLDGVRERFGIAEGAEVTIEANPGRDERGDLAGFAAAGMTRVSFGAQSFEPAELARLGRRHGPDDVRAAVEEARAARFASVSLDLLYDVPGQTLETWRRSLEAALALGPDHLSLYALTLDDPDAEGLTGPDGDHLPTRPGARRWRDRAQPEQDDDRAAAQYTEAFDLLERAGWRGYEISNWARPGHESRHNLAYWERRPYEAIGPGAHAFDGASRRWNAARLDRYVAALVPTDGRDPQPPPGGSETLDQHTSGGEAAILGLRLDHGVAAELLADARFGPGLRWGGDAGLIEPFDREGETRLRLTLRGRLLSNELFARLL